MSNTLQQLLDEQQVKSLLTWERYYRDTAQWQNLRNSYHPDASRTWIKITWYEGDIDGFVSGSQKMAQGGSSSFHTISPVEVHFNDKHGKALTKSMGSINARYSLDGSEYDCVSYVRFISRLEKVDGEWRMLTLEFIYDRDTMSPALPGGLAAPPNFDAKGHRDSYRRIGWLLASKGFEVDRYLPGIDRPESVASLMSERLAWLKYL